MKKIEITLNEEKKIIPITEEFDREFRVWNEFAGMALDNMFSNLSQRIKDNVFLPANKTEKLFTIGQIEIQYAAFNDKMENVLFKFTEDSFKVSLIKSTFIWESYTPTEEHIQDNIQHIYNVTAMLKTK